ncbi:MAG: flagellar biosynthetic protein FliR [Deltaproteobacteria bacterium]|nr:flagellar biosynthetic protein FliR [Deltaproteobacteria bacterium]
MGTPILNTDQLLIFTFVFLRIGAILVMIPVLGETSVPLRVKGGLAILISMLVFPFVSADISRLQAESKSLAVLLSMIGEVLIGITIGFAARLIFAGIQFAGDMVGIQMGFSIVNVIDPVSSAQVSIMAEFQYLIALLVYLAIDAHHIFLFAIVDSYRNVSVIGYHFSGSLIQAMMTFSKELFVTAVKISAPVMAVLLFTNVALGVIARTIPQMNVFIVGFPLQIAAGLIVFGLTIPVFVKVVQKAMISLGTEVHTLLRLM